MILKLNLASGTDIRDGWINMDVVAKWPNVRRGCDVIWDALKDPLPFVDNSVDEIYAGYLLLHLPPEHHTRVLREIRRVLKPDTGTAMFGEVDMAIVMERFLKTPKDARLAELIWGEQGEYHGTTYAAFDKHCHGFTESSLRETLRESGFSKFERVQIHSAAVFYELTAVVRKESRSENPFITVTMPTVRVGGLDLIFDSLREQTCKDFEFVLVDGLYKYRKDIVAEYAKSCDFTVRHVDAVDNPFPVTAYCRYANTALLHARGEIVLHLTDYSVLTPDVVARHVAHHRSNARNVGLMGPHVYYTLPPLNPVFPTYQNSEYPKYAEDLASGKLNPVLWSLFDGPRKDGVTNEVGLIALDMKQSKAAGPINYDFFHAKNESCALEALLEVNGWDEALDGAHGYQDHDIANRLRLRGMQWTLDPNLKVQVLNPRHVFPYMERYRSPKENEQLYFAQWALEAIWANPAWNLRELREKCLAGQPFDMPWHPNTAGKPVPAVQ